EGVTVKEHSGNQVANGLIKFEAKEIENRNKLVDLDQSPTTEVPVEQTIEKADADVAPSAFQAAHKVLSMFDTPPKISGSNDLSVSQKQNGEVLSPSKMDGSSHLGNETQHSEVKAKGYPPTSYLDRASPYKGEGQGTEETALTATGKSAIARFASVPAPTGKDEIIAKPHRLSKKKSRSKKSSPKGKLTRSASFGTETEGLAKREVELDAMSVSTISSVEEEEELAAKSYPDIRYVDGDSRESPDVKKFPEAAASLEERRHSETIPPLVDRLAAARSLEDSDDHLRSISLTSSGEHVMAGSYPRGSLSVLKDGLSLKLKNQTKSIIKSLKETNILSKSASTSKLDVLFDQKRPASGLSISPPPNLESPLSPPLSPGLPEQEDEDRLFELDTTPLYSLALEVKRKLLASPDALLNPQVTKSLLASWAREVVLAVGYVSLELHTRRRQVESKAETSAQLQANTLTTDDDISHKQKKNEVDSNSDPDSSTVSRCS
ncbi:hypothetical protein EGW08_012534, partial [Elysia chlorotica]